MQLGKRKKLIFWVFIEFIALVGILLFIFRLEIARLSKTIRLFDADQISSNFLQMENFFSVDTIHPGAQVYSLPEAPSIKLPETFIYKDSVFSTAEFIKSSNTSGLLVIQKDSIKYESYALGHGPDQTHISWSVCKSMISALVGVAIQEGHISSEMDEVTKYVPELLGTAYDQVPIKDILQMSSGAGFNEDYQDFNSDINRLGRYFALGLSLDKFAASLESERSSGEYHKYVSVDTQVLGMLIRNATGMDLSTYFETRIWNKMGAEKSAYWIEDKNGMEAAFGGLNATLRDYARFGLLFLHDGQFGENQVIPRDWVQKSITPDAPHLIPGEGNPLSNSNLGYGYQWWIPEGEEQEYLAIGVYNQFIYVNPTKNLVIVKHSSNLNYKTERQETNNYSIAFFKAISNNFQ